MRRFLLPALLLAALATGPRPAAAVPVAPPNFVVENAFPGVTFVVPTRCVWLPDRRALVSEKRGRVWLVTNGVKSAAPVISMDAKVLDANDRGLLGLAVDPNWFVNHYLYLLYTVDPDSDGVETNADAFARLERWTVNFTDSSTVVPNSRVVLIGDTWTRGIVSCSPSHTVGDLQWGADGSLLVSAGDGASFTNVDAGGQHPGCFTAGRTSTYEDIGAYRAQSLTSLAGKILRVNPANGQGYPSNPYWDGNASSIRSRVWAYGLRNPFRFVVRPGTGSTDPAAGDPGALFIGDVGWNTWEEQNVVTTGGRNFGWPCKEGALDNGAYQTGAQPAHNGCGSVGTADNPSAYSTPAAWYNHTNGVPSTPPGMWGNTAIGGMFYRGTSYPGQYRQQYLMADYGQNWIKLATVDGSQNILGVATFIDNADAPVGLCADPLTGDAMYVSITTGEIRRIRYTGVAGNAPPIPNATATPTFGAPPLAVAFSSAGTIEPDGDPFTLSWSFGDGTGSTLANPSHTYTTAGTFTAVLTATDNQGAIGRDTVVVTAANVPAFPSTAVRDNFNRANGAIGGSWVDQTTGLTVSSNQLAQTVSDNTVVWNGATFGPNQEAFVTLANYNASAPEHDLMLKVQGTSWAAGHVEVRLDGASRAVVVTTYAPSQGWIQRAAPIPATFASGDRFGARALADGTLELYRNAIRFGVVSLGDWPFAASGGRIGMTLVGLGAGRLDDFGGGDVVFDTNLPPVVHVTSPANRSFYVAGQTILMDGTATDDRTPADSLTYHWDVELHHNTHIHFALAFDTRTASFVADNHDDGSGVFYRLKFRATDKGALAGVDSVDIFPENDLVPSAVTVTPAAPTAADSLTYAFKVYNLGRLPARISRWQLVANASTVAFGDTVVGALDSVVVNLRRGPLPAGTQTLRLVADTLNVVVETNEANNATTRSLVVAPAVGPNHPPVAVAAGTPASGNAPLTVAFTGAGSSDPDADPLTYAWAFGDGGTATGATASHAYAAAGSYAAILTVTDGRGGSDTASVAISVSPAPAGFPATAVLDNFNRANGALGASWLNAAGLSISSNQLAPGSGDYSPVWNGGTFGADQEAYVTLARIASSAPEHDLILKVQGNTWDTGHIEVRWDARTGQVIVSTYAPGPGWVTRGAGIPVAFAAGDRFGARALANGDVQVYRNATLLGTRSVTGWAFAANGGRIGLTLSGASSARLDDFGGGNVSGAPANRAPVAVAAGTPASGTAPLSVAFTSAGSSDPDGDPLTFAWAFGDGGTATGATASHTYAAAGGYTATLTVSDGRGGTATATVAISVSSGTPPPAFPATAVLDNFDRANGAIGGAWVDQTAGLTIASNQLAQTATDNTVVWNGGTFGPDQEAYVTVATLNGAAPEHDLMLKVQGTSWSSGHVEVKYDAPAGAVWVTTYAPTQGWISRGGPIAMSLVSGDRYGARALASGSLEVYRNATKVATVSLGDWPFAASGGRVGLTLVGLGSGRLDNFGGGTMPAAALLSPTGDVLSRALPGVIPGALALSAPSPNPSRAGVALQLDLPRESDVDFRVFDLAGRELSAEHGTRGAGRWTLEWSGRDAGGRRAAPGVYLARVAAGGIVMTRRIVRLP